jgi:hypothetical protein
MKCSTILPNTSSAIKELPMSKNEIINLAATECIPGRPCTDLVHTLVELQVLDQMRVQLREQIALLGQAVAPVTLQLVEHDQREQRMIILNPSQLRQPECLFVVGFFGQRRPDPDTAAMTGVDDALITELTEHRSILAYCSLQLGDGNWGNLVVLADSAAAQHWRSSTLHTMAAYQLSPRYYATIRLHNAILPNGLASLSLNLIRTTYYDFSQNSWWQAVRHVSPTERWRG